VRDIVTSLNSMYAGDEFVGDFSKQPLKPTLRRLPVCKGFGMLFVVWESLQMIFPVGEPVWSSRPNLAIQANLLALHPSTGSLSPFLRLVVVLLL